MRHNHEEDSPGVGDNVEGSIDWHPGVGRPHTAAHIMALGVHALGAALHHSGCTAPQEYQYGAKPVRPTS